MKILSANQIKEWDSATIKNEPIKSLALMERAATLCADQIMLDFHNDSCFHIIANKGNNGGDGLVIARKLLENRFKVRITVLEFLKKASDEFNYNLSLISKNIITYINPENKIDFNDSEIIIDAIFGYGLNRLTSSNFAEVIRNINKSNSKVLSIDMPSGLFAEDNRMNNGEIVKADITYTFQCMKLSFLLESYTKYVGELKVINIGLDTNFLKKLEINNYLLTKNEIPLLLKRSKISHKGNFGHALLIGGKKGMRGAIILSARSALRTGVGKVSVSLPNEYIQELNIKLPEAMLDNNLTKISDYNALGIGPGMGTDKAAEDNLKELLKQRKKVPLVLDADALNVISNNNDLLQFSKGAVITPHIGEFKRLCGDYKSDEEKLEKQIEFARKYKIIVVLKGIFTTIATPSEDLFFNTTGNSGMATAGSGDVLTGIILALLAQGYSAKNAACLGVFLHGYSADLALKNQS